MNNYSPNYSEIFINGKLLKVDTLLIVDAFKLSIKITYVLEVFLPLIMDNLINSGSSFVNVYNTNWINFKNEYLIIIILIAFNL